MTTPHDPRFWFELPDAPAPGTLVCERSDLPDGQATLADLPALAAPQGQPFKIVLLRSGDAVHAFVNRCAHFGVPLAAKQEHLIFKPRISLTCNVHYAHYRWDDGSCASGDCEGSALLPVPLMVNAQGQVAIAPTPAQPTTPTQQAAP